MQSAAIRSSIVDIVTGLTPQTVIGSRRFVEVEDIVDASEDRQFVLGMTSPTAITGGTVNLGYTRYITEWLLTINYKGLDKRSVLQQRISEDMTDIQQELLDTSNFAGNCSALQDIAGDSYFDASIDNEDMDGLLVSLRFATYHK